MYVTARFGNRLENAGAACSRWRQAMATGAPAPALSIATREFRDAVREAASVAAAEGNDVMALALQALDADLTYQPLS
jgi:hypothetical protein